MSMRRVYDQQETLRGRLPIVAGLMIIATVYLTGQLVSFQTLPPQVVAYMQRQANYNYNRTLQLAASRGVIYDRDGQPFALNTLEYEIGLSPNLIANPRSLSTQLAAILNQSELEIYDAVTTRSDWVQLARPVSADVAQQVRDLELIGITINPLPRRLYPQGTLAAQVIGFVAGDDSGAQGYRGYNGVEGYYEDELAGRVRDQQVSNIPFDLPSDRAVEDRGSDLVLTIDRDIQFLIESELQAAVTSTGSTQGTIIVMNPRNGDILGMASYPSFDPNNFIDVDDPDLLKNPAISDEYEPGSVFKVLTMAAALEAGTVTQYDT